MKPTRFWILAAAAMAAGAYYGALLDRTVEIKFDPARDGPLTIEKPWVASKPGAPGMCLTSLATGTGGATGTIVYTPCPISTIITTHGSGGTYVTR